MTVRWIEGFEIHQQVAYLAGKYQNQPTVFTADTGRIFGTSAEGLTLVTRPLIGSPGPEWIVGMGIKIGSNPDPDTDFIKFFNGGLEQFGLHIRADRILEVRRGTTVIETGVVALPNNDWAYIEFKAKLHVSAGSYEVRIDGTTEMTGTGLDTSFSNLNDADVVKFASISNHRFDDIYVLDTAGGVNLDFLGPRAVEGLLPISEGDTLEWGASAGGDHFALVDDPATALNLADFVEDDTVGQDDLYGFAPLVHLTGDINALAVGPTIALEGVASRTYRVKYRGEDNVEGNGPTVTVDSTGSQTDVVVMEEDPRGTPTAWTNDDINTGQFGVEVVS